MAKIPGTNVAAPIAPFDTQDKIPTHMAIYGLGGLRSVATTALRDAIPTERLEDGCEVYVIQDKTKYVRENGSWIAAVRWVTKSVWDAGDQAALLASAIILNITED